MALSAGTKNYLEKLRSSSLNENTICKRCKRGFITKIIFKESFVLVTEITFCSNAICEFNERESVEK